MYVNNREAANAIAQLREFKNSTGSLRGKIYAHTCEFGSLPMEWRRKLADDMKANEPLKAYIVFSYSTPIAWFINSSWFIPDVKYSVTTSRHQSYARRATNSVYSLVVTSV